MNQQPRNPNQGEQQPLNPGNQGGGNQSPQRDQERERQDGGSDPQRQPNQPKPQGDRQK